MTTRPNWVDLLILIVLLRAAYKGFDHGLIFELLSLAALIAATAIAANYYEWVAGRLEPWMGWFPSPSGTVVIFFVLFLILLVTGDRLAQGAARLLSWERSHWAVQGAGLAVGGLRGLWWTGLMLMLLSASGVAYLRDSVEAHSVFGPKFLDSTSRTIVQVVDRFPGASQRTQLTPRLR